MNYEHYSEDINKILKDLAIEVDADGIMLLDKQGNLCFGQGAYRDALTLSIHSTIKGDLFEALASHPGSRIERPGLAFQQTPTHGVFIAEVVNYHILLLILPKGTHIGLVKQCTKRDVQALNTLLATQ